jgi:YggT family protein
MNLNPFIDLINTLLSLYNLVLISWLILGWLTAFNIINSHQPLVQKISKTLHSLTNPALTFVKRFVPSIGGVDISFIILLIGIQFIKNILRTYLYK